MTYHLFDGVDPFTSPSGPFHVSLSLVPITEAPSGSSEASLSCGSVCWWPGTDRGPMSTPSWSVRPGEGQAHRELGIALRRAPKETENGCLQAQPSYAASSPQHLVLRGCGFTALFSAGPTVSALAVFGKCVLDK